MCRKKSRPGGAATTVGNPAPGSSPTNSWWLEGLTRDGLTSQSNSSFIRLIGSFQYLCWSHTGGSRQAAFIFNLIFKIKAPSKKADLKRFNSIINQIESENQSENQSIRNRIRKPKLLAVQPHYNLKFISGNYISCTNAGLFIQGIACSRKFNCMLSRTVSAGMTFSQRVMGGGFVGIFKLHLPWTASSKAPMDPPQEQTLNTHHPSRSHRATLAWSAKEREEREERRPTKAFNRALES